MSLLHKKAMYTAAAIINMLATSALAAAPATVDQKPNMDSCTIRSPQENNRPPSQDGLTNDELLQLAQISASDAEWVKWYVGGKDKFDLLTSNNGAGFNTAPQNGPRVPVGAPRQVAPVQASRLVNYGKCADMTRFVQVANHDLYLVPKMSCASGNVGFTFTKNPNGLVIMEISQLVAAAPTFVQPAVIPGAQNSANMIGNLPGLMVPAQPIAQAVTGQTERRSLYREPIMLQMTAKADCKIKITEITGSGLNLDLCLPQKPENRDGEGRVSMTLNGVDTNGELACQADPQFLEHLSSLPGAGLLPPGAKLPIAGDARPQVNGHLDVAPVISR